MKSESAEPTVSFPSVAVLGTYERSAPALENRTIHLWGFSLDGGGTILDRFEKWLSPEEQVRSTRFIHREHRIRFILAHGGLRALLGRYLGRDPSDLQFGAGATGKPVLLDEQSHFLHFNLSHSHGRMLVAVTQGRAVGVDLEQIRDRVEVLKLAERFYRRREYEDVLNRNGAEQAIRFYRYWVAKEALLKGQGVGLPLLQQCEIHSSAEVSANVQIVSDSALEASWTVQWLNCGMGWQGAVSAQGREWSLRVLTERAPC